MLHVYLNVTVSNQKRFYNIILNLDAMCAALNLVYKEVIISHHMVRAFDGTTAVVCVGATGFVLIEQPISYSAMP